ncbi:MAG: hypothetical protein KC776_03600, partial [Myxococcales bacterium]|nr:hypothetical protein [Myxococcales bacterium]
ATGGNPGTDAGAGGAPGTDAGAGGAPSGADDSGCSCRTPRNDSSPRGFGWLALLAVVAARRARRASRRTDNQLKSMKGT